MTSEVYYAEGLIKAWYEHGKNTLVIRLLHFNIGEHRQPSLDHYLKALKKYEPTTIIIDSGEARGMYFPAEIDFFKTTTFPKISKTCIKTLICVFPKNPIARMAARGWLDIGEQFGLKAITVPDMENAYAHL